MENVEQNDEKICKGLKELFKQWIDEYEPTVPEIKDAPIPTEEELAMIKMLKKKGLI